MNILVKPLCRVDLVSLERTSVGVDARELDIRTEVVPALKAKETISARNTWLNSHSITCVERVSQLFNKNSDVAYQA